MAELLIPTSKELHYIYFGVFLVVYLTHGIFHPVSLLFFFKSGIWGRS